MTGIAKETGSVCRLGFSNDFALGLGDIAGRRADIYAELTK